MFLKHLINISKNLKKITSLKEDRFHFIILGGFKEHSIYRLSTKWRESFTLYYKGLLIEPRKDSKKISI